MDPAQNRSPSVLIKPANLRDLTYTAANARDIDKKEILASGPRSMVECGAITWHFLSEIGGEGYVVWIDDNPEFAFGITRQSPLTPWLGSAWAWGTEKGAQIGMPEMARWGRTDLLHLVNRWGLDRVEARSIIDHTQAHRWLEWMHFRREAELVDWGRDRARFVLYAWSRSDFEEKAKRNGLRGVAQDAATGALDVLRRRDASAATTSGVTDNGRHREHGTRSRRKNEGR